MLAKIEADKAGYEEAILLDTHGYVSEGTGENLFIDQGRVIATPTYLSTSSAASTAPSAIQIASDLGYELQERNVARDELYLADEIFMTGTAAELTPCARSTTARSARASRARSRARSSASSRTRCTGARSATPTGTTWCPCPRPAS